MIISVHLPKTAGTSFMKSLKAYFGNGLRLDNNDLPINTKPYERKKAALKESIRIAEHWENTDVKCIHGHFLPLKYLLLGVKKNIKFVTWMRDPVERLLSHYYFWRNCYHREWAASLHRKVVEENWSLEKFCLSPFLRNLYGQFLWGFNFEQFDYIGITEFYNEDLNYLSKLFFDADLVVHKELINDRKDNKYKINDSLRKKIESFHEFDMYLYRRALEIRQNRMQSGKKNA